MVDSQLLLVSARHRLTSLWGHLSATQHLMLRGVGVVTAVLMLGALAGTWASPTGSPHIAVDYTGTAGARLHAVRRLHDVQEGELRTLEVRRGELLAAYALEYDVDTLLAELVYETALRQGIDPELGFRLIHLESQFRSRALSRAGAIGLAQVQLATARFYVPGITHEELYAPETNLRIGFSFLRDLIDTYGNVEMALLAYNWGPSRLRELLAQGRNPRNGYASSIMRGYQGTW
jgi:soluble lytic murein transglycosylase-like protein